LRFGSRNNSAENPLRWQTAKRLFANDRHRFRRFGTDVRTVIAISPRLIVSPRRFEGDRDQQSNSEIILLPIDPTFSERQSACALHWLARLPAESISRVSRRGNVRCNMHFRDIDLSFSYDTLVRAFSLLRFSYDLVVFSFYSNLTGLGREENFRASCEGNMTKTARWKNSDFRNFSSRDNPRNSSRLF